MKKEFLAILLLFISCLEVNAQNEQSNHTSDSVVVNNNKEEIVINLFRKPSPGYNVFKYLQDNLRTTSNVSNVILVAQFVVEKDGSLSNIIFTNRGNPIEKELEEALLKVMQSMPKWQPGQVTDGRNVRSRYRFPIQFN